MLGLGIVLFASMKDPTLEINVMSYVAAAIGIPAGLFFLFGINEVELSNQALKKLNIAKAQTQSQGDTYRAFNQST